MNPTLSRVTPWDSLELQPQCLGLGPEPQPVAPWGSLPPPSPLQGCRGIAWGWHPCSGPAVLTPGRSQACPKLMPVTALNYQPHLVHYPKKAVCLLEAKHLQQLEGTG